MTASGVTLAKLATLTSLAAGLGGLIGNVTARVEAQAQAAAQLVSLKAASDDHDRRIRRIEGVLEVLAYATCIQIRKESPTAPLPRACLEQQP